MGKVTEHFWVEDFVPKNVWLQFGDNSIWFFEWQMVLFAELLRESLGKPVIANTWKDHGSLQGRGFRNSTIPEYKPYSQHSFGRAIDVNVAGMSSYDLSDWVIKHRDAKWPWITAIEDPSSTIVKDAIGRELANWLHADMRPMPYFWDKLLPKNILIVKP